MKRRMVVNLLLCLFSSLLVGTGVVLLVAGSGRHACIEQSPWHMMHSRTSIVVFILACIHVYFNRRALGAYLKRARVRTIAVFAVSAAALLAIISLGILDTVGD